MNATRREMLLGGAAAAMLPATTAARALGQAALPERIAAAELRSKGRLGVAILDTGTGKRFGWRADEAFPLCSTFKLLLAASILRRVDRGQERLDRAVPVTAKDIVSNSPFTADRIGQAVEIGALCEAAMTLSDNSAANLLLATIGGPAGLTRFARTIGDRHTRLDRWETQLGECTPGDPRDTTRPASMLANLRVLISGNVLGPVSRAKLVEWLGGCRTGDGKLRAGLPAVWRIGEKTGGGEHGTTNDVAIFWPPARPPLLVAAYLTETPLDPAARNAILALVGAAVIELV